jgi:hypothetical protein
MDMLLPLSCCSALGVLNLALGLNTSQPPSQNCADDNDKQNGELHLPPPCR